MKRPPVPKPILSQNTSGHESPNIASKINVLQQKSPPRAKLFGAGVIVPWTFCFAGFYCRTNESGYLVVLW